MGCARGARPGAGASGADCEELFDWGHSPSMKTRWVGFGLGLFLASALVNACTNSTGVVCPGGCGAGADGSPMPVQESGAPGDGNGGQPDVSLAFEASSPEAAGPDGTAPPEGSLSEASQGADAGSDATESGGGLGTNLVTDGDFSQPNSPLWAIVVGTAPIAVSNGELCVMLPANAQVTLGWPEPAATQGPPLTAGTSYTFTYKARATQPLIADAKVGLSMMPYTADFDAKTEAVTTALQTFTHTFTAPQADASAGIAFTFPMSGATNQVCFQAVGLFAN